MSSPTLAFDTLTDAAYDRRAQAALASIEATVDRLLEEDVIDIDASRTGGLLELSLPNGSKLIVNTQPPLQELWLAAASGGYHFRLANDRWIDSRGGGEFFAVLSTCASQQSGTNVVFTE